MLEKTKSPAKLDHSLLKWLSLLLLALSLLVAVGVRVRLLNFPLERDEGCFAYMGQLILGGIPPYQLAYDFKMPGLYLSYAVMMFVFGQTPAGIHLGLLVVHLATLAVLFLVARKLLDLHGAAIATAAYALMTLSQAYLGLAAQAEHFVMLPALLGILMLFRLEKDGRLVDCIAGGCLFGVAFLMKQPGMFFGIFGGLYLAWISIAEKIAWKRLLVRLGVYSLGCLLPFFVICIWLKIAGVFPNFWFWAFTYPGKYADIISLYRGMEDFNEVYYYIFNAAPLLWIIAGSGLFCLWQATRLALNTRIFLGGFLVFSFLAVCPGLYFRQHYFILLVPAIALLAGLAVSCSLQWITDKRSAPWMCSLPVLLAAVACAQSLYADRAVFFLLPPREACRAVYGSSPFPEALDIAHYIEQNTRKGQKIAVLGSEPEIFFYAHRHSSTAHIYVYPLMEPRPYAQKMQEDMIHEIEQNPPEYLVFISIPISWLARPDSSHQLFTWMDGYLKQNMQLVGVIKSTGPQTTKTVWGPEAATTPLSSDEIAVYKRVVSP